MYDFNNYKDVVKLFEGSINLIEDPKLKTVINNYTCGNDIYNYIKEKLCDERLVLLKQHGPIVYYLKNRLYISLLIDNKEVLIVKSNETHNIDIIKSYNKEELKKYNLENATCENDGYVYFIVCLVKEDLDTTKIHSSIQISKKDAKLLFTRMKNINDRYEINF